MLDRLLEWSPNWELDTFLLLPVLIALEAVLSADNAIALAAIAQGLQGEKLQKQALNVGLVAAFALRVVLILTATWVLKYWQFEVAGALYLLWLVYQHFFNGEDGEEENSGPKFVSLWQAIPVIALTDLAFSLDSVTTAIALSDEVLIVLLGGVIGVLALRFMAGLFIHWLDEYERLEDAGFVTVAFVGVRLLIRVINESWVPPQWVMVTVIALVFAWGFSKRHDSTVPETLDSTGPDTTGPDTTEPDAVINGSDDAVSVPQNKGADTSLSNTPLAEANLSEANISDDDLKVEDALTEQTLKIEVPQASADQETDSTADVI